MFVKFTVVQEIWTLRIIFPFLQVIGDGIFSCLAPQVEGGARTREYFSLLSHTLCNF